MYFPSRGPDGGDDEGFRLAGPEATYSREEIHDLR